MSINPLLHVETLIGFEFTPADTHILPATGNVPTHLEHHFYKKHRNIDILTGMPADVPVWSTEEEGNEINLLTGAVELTQTDANDEEKGSISATTTPDSPMNATDEACEGTPLSHQHADNTCDHIASAESEENGDCPEEQDLKNDTAEQPTKASQVADDADLISFDMEAPITFPPPLAENESTTLVTTKEPNLSSNIQVPTSSFAKLPEPAVTSGPSYILPNEIKSAYGLNREREFFAAVQANEEEVMKGLEHFREKLRREQVKRGQ